jgi:hypothetical protein
MKRFRQRPTEAKPLTNTQTAMIVDDASAPMAQAMDAAAEALASLRSLRFARIFRGGLPMVVALFAAACGAGVAVAIVGTEINGEQIVLGTVCGLLIGIFALGGGGSEREGRSLSVGITLPRPCSVRIKAGPTSSRRLGRTARRRKTATR